MRTPVYIHRTDSITLQPPGMLLPLVIATTGLVLAVAFGAMGYFAITASFPGWLETVPFLPLDTPSFRTLMVIIGGFNCVMGIMVMSAYLARAWSVMGHRAGLRPVMISQGPCRLIQDEPHQWGLHLSVTDGDDPGHSWPLTASSLPETSAEIFFRLDEATAGTVSRLFNPGDVLTLQWLDLPMSAGGPTLLEVRSPVREAAAMDPPQEDGSIRVA